MVMNRLRKEGHFVAQMNEKKSFEGAIMSTENRAVTFLVDIQSPVAIVVQIHLLLLRALHYGNSHAGDLFLQRKMQLQPDDMWMWELCGRHSHLGIKLPSLTVLFCFQFWRVFLVPPPLVWQTISRFLSRSPSSMSIQIRWPLCNLTAFPLFQLSSPVVFHCLQFLTILAVCNYFLQVWRYIDYEKKNIRLKIRFIFWKFQFSLHFV